MCASRSLPEGCGCSWSPSPTVGLALGAQAGEKRLREVLTEAGFTHVRRVAETPANMILEVRA